MSSYNGPVREVSLSERREIVERVLGRPVAWDASGEWGYTECPGIAAHANQNRRRDCRVWAAEKPQGSSTLPPGVHCLHTSCSAEVAAVNHRLRSEIGKAKVRGVSGGAPSKPTGQSGAQAGRTHRTPFFHVSQKRGGSKTSVRTFRTGFSYPSRVHAQARAHTLQEGANVEPSGASEGASTPVQPRQLPTPAKPDAAGRGGDSDDGEVTLIVGDVVEKGRWVNGEWVARRTL